ncbi:MAG: HAD family hydrolase [Ruminococcus sp.]|nr:HAD family hydrolase [Ruminococcus sp.]
MNNCAQKSGGGIIAKRLYISDLDGTLLSPEPAVTERTADIINSLIGKGMFFTFATARSVYSAVPITAALRVNVPCMLMNGVSIYDIRQKAYIKSESILPEASAEVLSAFERHGIRCFMYRIDSGVLTCYYSQITTKVMRSFAEVRRNRYEKPFVQVGRLADHADSSTVYFTTTGPHSELFPLKCELERIRGVDIAFYLDVYNGEWYLEVFSDRASKANGVDCLREMFGFDEVVCFGDNLNDLPMFAQSDVRVAVGNAKPEVRAAADFIAPPNTEDGVARWLTDNFI